MARQLGRLKTAQIGKLGPGRYADGGGLYLNVTRAASRSWIFRYRIAGRLRDYGLGPTHTVTLAEAREKARGCRNQRLNDLDPIDERKARRQKQGLEAAKTMTFKQAAEQFIAGHQSAWRGGKSEQQWRQSLASYVYPVLGDLPVQAIDTALVTKALELIWSTKTETASRVRGRIESILGWAATRGYRQGENPARWKGHLENLLPNKAKVHTVKHHAALRYAEIATLMVELRQQEGIAVRALEFLILTAARSDEVIGARWDEINMVERIWIVPANRMKGRKEHRVPLSEAAMAILEQMMAIRSNAFVFPGARLGRPIGAMALTQVLQRMHRKDVTTHGFRSTFRDWAAERTEFPAELAEMALAHQVGNVVERAYRRSDMMAKRRQLLEAWSTYCAAAPTASEVVSIGQARQLQQPIVDHHRADADADAM